MKFTATIKHPRLSWSRNPRETGLRAVGHTRGYTLKANGQRVATCTRSDDGWYWCAGWSYPDVPHQNSVFDGKYYDDPDDAKTDAEVYVRNALGMPSKASPKRSV